MVQVPEGRPNIRLRKRIRFIEPLAVVARPYVITELQVFNGNFSSVSQKVLAVANSFNVVGHFRIGKLRHNGSDIDSTTGLGLNVIGARGRPLHCLFVPSASAWKI